MDKNKQNKFPNQPQKNQPTKPGAQPTTNKPNPTKKTGW